MLKLLSVLVLVLTFGVGNVWGVDFSFSSAPTGWPSSSSSTASGSTEYTYTVGTTSYSFLLAQGCYVTSSVKLYHPKSKSTGLPALSGYKLTKVVGVLNDSGSPSTKSEVSITTDGSTPVTGGTKQTWSTKGNSYTYNLTGTSANTRYYLTVSGTANCQIKSLSLTYTSTGGSTYTITYADASGEGTNGSYSASSTTSIASGVTITLSATPDDCYELNAWDVYKTGATGTKVSVSNNQFTMPAYNVTVGATFQAKAAGRTVNFDAGAGVCATTSLQEDCLGAGVTLPNVTASGICKGWTTFAGWATSAVSDSTTTSVTLYAAGSTFTPSSDGQTLYAVFSKTKGSGPSDDTQIMNSSGSLNANWTDEQDRNNGIQSYAGKSSFQMYGETNTLNACELTSQIQFTNITGISINVAANNANTVSLFYSANGSDWTTWSNTVSVSKNTTSYTDYDFNMSGFPSGSYYICLSNSKSSLYMYSVSITSSNSTTYYCSDPNCCTELGSINGSVLRTHF